MRHLDPNNIVHHFDLTYGGYLHIDYDAGGPDDEHDAVDKLLDAIGKERLTAYLELRERSA